MATIPIIQLLRNNNIYSSRDAARSALEGQKGNVPDGGVILARYSGTTGEQMVIKTLAGFVSNISTSENATVTIIDVEGASENVQDAIDALSAYTNTKLTEEKNARESADNTLQTNIDNLSSSTDTKINAEVTRATEKEAELSSTITSNYTTLSTAIDDEKKRAEAKESDLNAKIQALDGSLGDTVSTTVASGEYSSQDKKIYLKNISGETLSEIDATDFIKDGMVSNVEVADGNLKISFNTDAGHEDINIPISAIFNANNYYTKTEVDTAIANVDVTEQLQNYYTKTEVDEKDAAINSTIEAYGQVTSQSLNDLGTRLDDYGKVTSQSLNDLSTKFSDYYTKEEVDTAIANVDVTEQLQNYYTKTEVDSKIANEASARESSDTTLQTNIDNVNSSITAHTANTVVHVTQADKDKWNTPTDLSNYYTKAEVDGKDAAINSTIESYGQVTSQALNDLGTRMDDYGKVTSQSLNDLSTKFGDYYTKTEVDTAISNVDVTGQLQNYYTKTEVDSKDATLQTALDALEARIAELETKFLNMENNGLQAGEY